jgi:hypothetical protein
MDRLLQSWSWKVWKTLEGFQDHQTWTRGEEMKLPTDGAEDRTDDRASVADDVAVPAQW